MQRVGFADVLRIRLFAVVYLAETQSIVGDQLARVALSILIFNRTGSTVETALVYALTYLPTIVGGGVLSGVADRYSRRVVMIVVDALRAVLIAATALPGIPNGGLFVLVTAAVFLGPAFTSAEVSVLASAMDTEHYRVASGLRMITSQVAQVAGFAAGGGLVALIGARTTLAVDAATYALSALIIAALVSSTRKRGDDKPPAVSLRWALGALWRDPVLRALLGLSWLAGFFIAPEGLAAPYAQALGRGSETVGALLAMIPLGAVFGAFVVLKLLRPEQRHRASAPMAMLAGIPLILSVSIPPLPVSLALWFASGACAAYQLDAITAFVQRIDGHWRGRAVSVAAAGLTAAQGLGLIAFGALGAALDPGRAIAVAGALGTIGAGVVWLALRPAPAPAGLHRRRSGVSPHETQ